MCKQDLNSFAIAARAIEYFGLRVWFRNSCVGLLALHGGLEVLCEFAIAPDPREKPFDDPAPRDNSEADLIRVFAHDLDRDRRRLGDLLAGIPAVSEELPDEREDAA